MSNDTGFNDNASSDVELVAAVAAAIARPRVAPANSFILHAPLELCARATLLPFVVPDDRSEARRRIHEMVDPWESHSPPASDPPEVEIPTDRDSSMRLLGDALRRGDVDRADAAAIGLARTTAPAALAACLVDSVLPRTSAAAHAPIFLYLFPRVSQRGEITPLIMRPLVRELARFADWRISWPDDLGAEAHDASGLFDAIATTPAVSPGESNFVHPTMMRVDESGVADRQLRTAIPKDDLPGARVAILRAAALSMVTESDDDAPYGWSHALTMPQAVLSIAPVATDPAYAIAIAATYVVGFRALHARQPLRNAFAPESVNVAWPEAIDAGSRVAAAAVWHATDLDAVTTTLATRAAVHSDAHLVKYTVACLDAAASDPPARRLFLAACAHLHGVWATTATRWSD